MQETILERISKEQKQPLTRIRGVAALLADGNTVPFIARYRKEQTGGLDEVALLEIKERLDYFEKLEARKETILSTIEKQDKLTEQLRRKIEECTDQFELEDLYLPYKPKRKTRAQVARTMGLEPLADRIFEQGDEQGIPLKIAEEFGRTVGITNPEEALSGALDILAERICETPEIRRVVRDLTWREGMLECRILGDEGENPGKYETFRNNSESIRNIPSHRVLAIMRGSREKELAFRIDLDAHEIYAVLDSEVIVNGNSIWKRDLLKTIRDAYERLLAPQIETEIRQELKQRADEVAVNVFADNVRGLLLAPPLKDKAVMALDPGYRTGVKLTIIDKTGKFLDGDTVYPTPPKNDLQGTYAVFDRMLEAHGFGAVAVGNGTAGKETFKAVRAYLKERGRTDIVAVLVNESGASIYSASEVAREEFPELDVTVRGSISIGRRLQDPLAELVKIDPKSIGVGQYQHDVDQKRLAAKLDEVVEMCVNSVGVDLNTASAPLLARVSGLNAATARNIVAFRNENGPFEDRRSLLKVSRFGEKSFEQAAGFLRVVGAEPLDNSAVHPERYEVVRRMAEDLGVEVGALFGNAELIGKIDKSRYLGEDVGNFTLDDILAELAKPNRDPRKDFSLPEFSEEINDITDLEVGMLMEGAVTNVTKFGAFVDIGVHQDGMIHVSELDARFVSDPGQVVKVGDKVRVKVIEVDAARKRIGLSRKQTMEPAGPPARPKALPAEGRPERRREDGRRDGNTRPHRDSRPPRKDGNRRNDRPPRRDTRPPEPKKDVIASGRMADLLKGLKLDKD